MANNSSYEEATLKRGWLSITRPEKKHPKDYFVLLRPEVLECYKSASDVEQGSRRAAIRLQLRNCILIQSLKKEKVKNGFSLLIVPEGMFTMSAVSETEKMSWLNEIRDTMARQFERDPEIGETARPDRERKRKKSAGEISERSTNRLRLRLSRQKQHGSSVDDLDRLNSEENQRLRNSGFNPKNRQVDSSAVSLQTRQQNVSDGMSRIPRSNTPTSSVNLRHSGNQNLGLADWNLHKPSNNTPPQQNSQSCRDSRSSIPRNSLSQKDTWSSEYSVRDVRGQEKRDQQSLTGKTPGPNMPLDHASNTKQNNMKQNSKRSSTSSNEGPPPEPRHPLVWSLSDGNNSLIGGSNTPPDCKVLDNIQMGKSPTTQMISSQRRNMANSNKAANQGSLSVVTITKAASSSSRNDSLVEQNNVPKSPPTITIFRPNEATRPMDRPITMPNSEHAKSSTEPSLKPDVQKEYASRNIPNAEVKFTDTGISPGNPSFVRDQKRASFYTIKRRNAKNAELVDRPVIIIPQSRQPTLPVDPYVHLKDSLYVENQKLREQIRALTTTNYELESKIKFYGQQSFPKQSWLIERHDVSEGYIPPVSHQRDNTQNGLRGFSRPQEIAILRDRKRSASVEPGYVTSAEGVEPWPLKSRDPITNGPLLKETRLPNARRHRSKSRRSTTNDIPDPETIYALGSIHSEGRTEPYTQPIKIDRTQMRPVNPYDRVKKKQMSASMNTFNHTYESAEAMRTRNNLQNVPPPSRLLTPSIPEPTDPRYSSSMWCRLVELWSNLLNEERGFWKSQLQYLFSESLNRQFLNDPNNLMELLDKANRQHTEETVNLWKHIYESWIPRDYLDFFSEETRKIMVCLHSVIDSLFTMVSEMRSGVMRADVNRQLDHLKERLIEVRALDGLELSNDPDLTPTAKNSSGRLFDRKDPHDESMERPLGPQVTADSWFHTKELLKQSHSELLNQVYNVAELVGAALDADMEDNIRTAKIRGDHNINPLTALPRSGLQAAAKLQSVVLDLESRLDAVDQHDQFTGQTHSQPLVSADVAMNTKNAYAFSGSERLVTRQRTSHHLINHEVNVNGDGVGSHRNNTTITNNDIDDDDDEDTYVGLNSVISVASQDKPAYTVLTTTKAANPDGTPKKDSPVILVLQDNRENELYRKHAEIMDLRYSPSYPGSDVISIDSAHHDDEPKLQDCRTRKN